LSLSSSLSTIVQIIGIAAAAGIIAVIGTAGAIYVDMATFILSAVTILFIHAKDDVAAVTIGSSSEYFKSIWENLFVLA
jgi:hypothetical protein